MFAPGIPASILDNGNTGVVFTPDPELGNIEGFCLEHTFSINACITIFDGDTVIDTVLPPVFGVDPLDVGTGPVFDQEAETAVICWANTGGANVTRIEVTAFNAVDAPFIDGTILLTGSKFVFGDGSTEPTCQDQLQDLIDALNVKLDLATSYDRDWIELAIYELEWAQSPELWETSDRLSDLGTLFFGHNFHATYFLQCVSDQSLVDDCLVNIQDLLGCVVDAEIEFALENPDVRTNLLAYAEYFESFADAFADAELYLQAVLLHFYAWLFANNA